jgi:hypothetical protein
MWRLNHIRKHENPMSLPKPSATPEKFPFYRTQPSTAPSHHLPPLALACTRSPPAAHFCTHVTDPVEQGQNEVATLPAHILFADQQHTNRSRDANVKLQLRNHAQWITTPIKEEDATGNRVSTVLHISNKIQEMHVNGRFFKIQIIMSYMHINYS